MKFLLTFAIALGVSVALSSAACSYSQITLDPKTRSAVCIIDGEKHALNTNWRTPECDKCSCSKSGMQCCSEPRPAGFDKENCELILDKESCSYKVVQKNDHSQSCDFLTMVG